MSTDRTLPVVIYGLAPVPDWAWHKDKKVSTNTEYSGDLCKVDRKAELRKRALFLEEPFPRDPAMLDGVTRMKQEKPRTFEPKPFQVPKGATVIYCVKTGQPIGQMLTTYEYPPFAVHPDWIKTDGLSLDEKLERHKTREYVAYCLGLIDTFWRQKLHRQGNARRYMDKVGALEHHWSLVKAYDVLGQVSDIHLSELANALCRFCTYAPLSYRVLDDKLLAGQRTADVLADAAINGVLLSALQKASVRTLAQTENMLRAGASVKTPKFELRPSSIDDAAQGPSNIRAQAKSKEYRKNAKLNLLMSEIAKQFGKDLGWVSVQEKRPNQAQRLLGRLSRGSQLDSNVSSVQSSDEFENDLLAELEKHMGGTSFVADDFDDDENTVEVRTIPRALVESLVEPKPPQVRNIPAPIAEPVNVPQKSAAQSLLSRIRRN